MNALPRFAFLLTLLLAGVGQPASAQISAAAAEAEASPETPGENPADETAADAADPADEVFLTATAESSIRSWQWTHRPIVIFADTDRDPRVEEQLETLRAERDRLIERDVVVIVDADAAMRSTLREELRPRGFMVALVEKDGTIAFRRPSPRSGREILHAIDKLPMRREEMRAR